MAATDILQFVNSLNARRKRQRNFGWGLIILGIMTYIDGAAGISLPPIWLTGPLAFLAGTPMILGGFWLLVAAQKLPIREALLFASVQQGKITAPALAMGLDITLDTAETIVNHLVQKGYAQISSTEMEDGAIVYKVSGVEHFALK
jgi:hypothetical protein